jgi:hypothetical protein
VAAAIVALAGVLVAHAISGLGSPALAATPPPLTYRAPPAGQSGRQVLLRLAAQASRQPTDPTRGRYGYVKTAGWYLDTQVAARNATSTVVPSMTESWTAADGSGRVLKRALPALPGPHLIDAPAGQVLDDFNLRAGRRIYPLAVSTTPRILTRELAVGHPTSIGPVERFVAVTDLALDRPISPRLESAVLRVLARSPGLIDSGEVTDRAGRPGIAVSLDSRYSGLPTRYTLIFAPRTARLLGEEETLLGKPGEAPVVAARRCYWDLGCPSPNCWSRRSVGTRASRAC